MSKFMSDSGVVLVQNETIAEFDEIRSFLEERAARMIKQGATIPEVHLLMSRLLAEALIGVRSAT